MIYEVIERDNEVKLLKRINDDETISWIPMVAGNADYEAYLNPEQNEAAPNE